MKKVNPKRQVCTGEDVKRAEDREIGSNAVLDALNTAIESDQCYWFGLWAQMMKRRYNQ